MLRWNPKKREEVENKKIDDFLQEVILVCRKHGFSIEHEDSQGTFQVVDFFAPAADWLLEAHDNTTPYSAVSDSPGGTMDKPFLALSGGNLQDRRVPELKPDGTYTMRDPITTTEYSTHTGKEIPPPKK